MIPCPFHTVLQFDVVIIDEAAQAVEPSMLVPLVMGCKQVCVCGVGGGGGLTRRHRGAERRKGIVAGALQNGKRSGQVEGLAFCVFAIDPCSAGPPPLQVYLVGDPVQLPATVISRRALEYNYDNSLFKRLQTAGYPVKVWRDVWERQGG